MKFAEESTKFFKDFLPKELQKIPKYFDGNDLLKIIEHTFVVRATSDVNEKIELEFEHSDEKIMIKATDRYGYFLKVNSKDFCNMFIDPTLKQPLSPKVIARYSPVSAMTIVVLEHQESILLDYIPDIEVFFDHTDLILLGNRSQGGIFDILTKDQNAEISLHTITVGFSEGTCHDVLLESYKNKS